MTAGEPDRAGQESPSEQGGPPSLPSARKAQRTLEEFDRPGTDAGEAARSEGPGRGGPVAPPLPEGAMIAETDSGHVAHPWLRPDRVRAFPFQIAIARAALEQDILVVLPTGLGKTVIATLVAAERLRAGRGKVLFLAPTRPLVEQHARSFALFFRSLPRATFTGTVASPKREGAWGPSDAVFATPQLVQNDLEQGRYSLKDVALLIFDEAHRAVGHYAYGKIAAIYRSQRPQDRRVLGLTASPGGQGTKIDQVLGGLGIGRVEARTREDPDVAAYVQNVETHHVKVRLPAELEGPRQALRGAGHDAMVRLQRMGFLRNKPLRVTGVKDLVATRGMIMARPGGMGRKFGALYQLMLAMHFHHACELLETQGVDPLRDYIERVAAKEKPGRADRAFVANPAVEQLRRTPTGRAATSPGASGVAGDERAGVRLSHPKIAELGGLVEETLREKPAAKVLVFAQFRDTVRSIVEGLGTRGVSARRFVGQATRSEEDRGMNQREQARLIEDFRAGRFPVLVASSVAEEGLDIPDVDLVVFFEALPSEIRTIQRKGRTGRTSAGRVVILMTQGTRDEGYHRAERKRESAMLRHVRRFSADGRVPAPLQGPPAGPPVPHEAPTATRERSRRSRRRARSEGTGSDQSPSEGPPPAMDG